MRSIALFVLLVSRWISPSLATAERGSAERVLFYSSYLIEGYLGSTPTIAPGCVGRQGRCGFDEFLSYIWAKSDGGSPDRPVMASFDDRPVHPRAHKWEFTGNSLYTLVTRITGANKKGTGVIINGKVDWKRLMPSSEDFYDCLGKVGNPIGDGAAYLDTHREQREADERAAEKADADADKIGGPDKEDEATKAERKARDQRIETYDRLKKLVPFGKLAANGVYELRIKDREQSPKTGGGKRLAELERLLGFNSGPRPVPLPVQRGPNVAGLAGEYHVWDERATENVRTPEEIAAAMTQYKSSKAVQEHAKAIDAAKRAMNGAGCP